MNMYLYKFNCFCFFLIINSMTGVLCLKVYSTKKLTVTVIIYIKWKTVFFLIFIHQFVIFQTESNK